jgi:Predicted membrane protein (DUF2306)
MMSLGNATAAIGDSDDALVNSKILLKAGKPKAHCYDPVLLTLYLLTSYLSFGMVLWIMVAPASWLIGRSAWHREVLIPFLEEKEFYWLVPKEITTKYQEQSLIHVTHFLPGALWSLLVPFQLHPTWRNHNRSLHRFCGYVFVAASLAIATGVFIILDRDLTYDHFFQELPSQDNTSKKCFVLAFTLWFAASGIQSVRMARARKLELHQKWMIRHVAAGIWVAVQRLILVPICIVYMKKVTHPPPMNPSRWLQREMFAATALSALVMSVGIGEYTHRRIYIVQKQRIAISSTPLESDAFAEGGTDESSTDSVDPTSTGAEDEADLPKIKSPPTYSTEKNDPFLAGVYCVVTYLCIMMIVWVLLAPGSALLERSSYHREVLIPLLEDMGIFRVVAKHTVTKYQGHSLVQFTHILPAAVWSACIPFQLHPTWRNQHRSAHRRMGYLFAIVSLTMAFGVLVIVDRKLSFEHFFPDVPVTEHGFSTTIATPVVLLMALWFTMTLVEAIRMARARNLHLHQKWMVRHVASGVWVIGQRMIVFPSFYMIYYGEIVYPRPQKVPEWLRIKAFADSALIAIIFFVALGEITVRRLEYLRLQHKTTHHKAS